MDIRRLELIKPVLEEMVNNSVVSGVTVSVHKDGEEVYYGKCGYRDIENALPMERDTIFRLYSMSKPITSAAVMILVQEGKLDLAAPVNRYIPSFSNPMVWENGELVHAKREVRIKDLLNMTGGYSYGGKDTPGQIETEQLFEEIKDRMNGEAPMSTLEIAERIGKIPLDFHPGEAFRYGVSADILGAVVEVVSGMSFGSFLSERIFEPLGMNDTGFYVPDRAQNRLAKVYEETKAGQKLYTENHLGISNDMKKAPAFESGGAGLCSTTGDYAKFAQMLANGGTYHGKTILTPKTYEYMTTAMGLDVTSLEEGWGHLGGHTYANLLRIMKEPGRAGYIGEYGEFGWDGWLGAYVNVDRINNLVIVVMMQRKDSGTIELTRRVKNIVYSAL